MLYICENAQIDIALWNDHFIMNIELWRPLTIFLHQLLRNSSSTALSLSIPEVVNDSY